MPTLTTNVRTIDNRADKYTLKIVATENSTDITTNTSNITIIVSLKGPWAPSYYGYTTTARLNIDGTQVSAGSINTQISNSYVQLLSWTGNVEHESDGTKTTTISVYLSTNGTDNFLPNSNTYTLGNIVLTDIVRGLAKIHIDGVYMQAIPYINDSGIWKQAISYINSNGTWLIGV